MTTIDRKLEKMSERMKNIEEKLDIIMRHLNIETAKKVDANTSLKPVDIKLKE